MPSESTPPSPLLAWDHEQGVWFYDRDADAFRCLVDWLRNDVSRMQARVASYSHDDRSFVRRLAEEATFYQIRECVAFLGNTEHREMMDHSKLCTEILSVLMLLLAEYPLAITCLMKLQGLISSAPPLADGSQSWKSWTWWGNAMFLLWEDSNVQRLVKSFLFERVVAASDDDAKTRTTNAGTTTMTRQRTSSPVAMLYVSKWKLSRNPVASVLLACVVWLKQRWIIVYDAVCLVGHILRLL